MKQLLLKRQYIQRHTYNTVEGVVEEDGVPVVDVCCALEEVAVA